MEIFCGTRVTRITIWEPVIYVFVRSKFKHNTQTHIWYPYGKEHNSVSDSFIICYVLSAVNNTVSSLVNQHNEMLLFVERVKFLSLTFISLWNYWFRLVTFPEVKLIPLKSHWNLDDNTTVMLFQMGAHSELLRRAYRSRRARSESINLQQIVMYLSMWTWPSHRNES
jgi:hypothetical protein